MDTYLIKEIKEKKFWHKLILEFEDANIYQLWDYAKIVQGEKMVKYLALYDNNNLISLVQVRIKTIPIINRGVAYIFGGPIWKKKDIYQDKNCLLNIYYTLRNEFVINQKLLLRINPNIFENDKDYLYLKLPGFYKKSLPHNHKTIFLNLDDELDEIRSKLKHRWRKTLNRAERNEIEIVSGTTKELFNIFLKLYDQMLKRKKFKANVNPAPFGLFNEQIDEPLKARIFVAQKDGEIISALIGSAIGSTGIALFSATNEIGMKFSASNLLHWERIKWFKEMGCKRYDLGGVDPDTNKSVYEFKLGISQDEYAHLGIFEASENIFSKEIVYFAEYIKNKMR